MLVKSEVTSKLAKTISDEWEDKSRFTNSFAKFKVLGIVYWFFVKGDKIGTKYFAKLYAGVPQADNMGRMGAPLL